MTRRTLALVYGLTTLVSCGPAERREGLRDAETIDAETCGAPIAFVSRRHGETAENGDGVDDIYIMNEDGSHVSRVLLGAAGHSLPSTLPKWSPDGKSLTFEGGPVDEMWKWEVYVVEIATKEIRQITDNDDLIGAIPAFSPSGAKIAFTGIDVSNRDIRHIYTINADGTEETQITTHPSSQQFPGWSPDGARITYMSNEDGDFEIFTIDVATRTKTQLTFNDVDDAFPHWSLDGNKISFQRRQPGGSGDNDDIFVLDLANGTEQQVTTDAARDDDATLSADSRRVLFNSDRSGAQELYIADVDGPNVVQLTYTGVRDAHAHWAPVSLCVQDLVAP